MKFVLAILSFGLLLAYSEAGCQCNHEVYDPVCTSDGKTHKNNCDIICDDILGRLETRIVHKGPCSKGIPCDCPRYVNPVCDNHGTTWPNECVMKCAKKKATPGDRHLKDLKVTKMGPCGSKDCDCSTAKYEPVCGSDGNTYKNRCVLACFNTSEYYNKVTGTDGACKNNF